WSRPRRENAGAALRGGSARGVRGGDGFDGRHRAGGDVPHLAVVPGEALEESFDHGRDDGGELALAVGADDLAFVDFLEAAVPDGVAADDVEAQDGGVG